MTWEQLAKDGENKISAEEDVKTLRAGIPEQFP